MNRSSNTLAENPADLDVDKIREDFPILAQTVYGKPLVYFDNAATSQKPQMVIDALVDYYSRYNANIHRGVHYLSQHASQAYDDVRAKVRQFINASSEKEIIFLRGTTEAINLVAATYGKKNIRQGDEIIISAMEHHSNIVPWQMLCEEKKAQLKIIPINNKGELLYDEFIKLISERTKFISVAHISNSLGTVNPVKKIIAKAHEHNIPVMIDGAQSAVHSALDIQDLDCDFFAFSSHKMLGPTGVGILYGKMELLENMPPFQGGGDMIQSVSFEKTIYNEVPFKFEAGTPNIADVIAFGKAIDYWSGLDRQAIEIHEKNLLNYATEKLKEIKGINIIGTAEKKASIVSFTVDGINSLDLGMYLDTQGIAVRTGQHCAEPVMDFYKIPGTLRASFLFYNKSEEIDRMITAVKHAITFLK